MTSYPCPVLQPTREEFEDFYKYMLSVEERFRESSVGLVKIIPPSGWRPTVPIDDLLKNFSVEHPIKQFVKGRAGSYSIDLVELDAMTLGEFKEQADRFQPTPEDNEGIEKQFWKLVSSQSHDFHPIYGADIAGSLFNANESSSWNINQLDSILKLLPDEIPGVNTAMIYVGMWAAMFAYHVEDYNLFSINYLHYGKPKHWYSVSPSDKKRFESMAQAYFQDDFSNCREFVRHKTTLFSPSKLKEGGMTFSTAVQQEGEFMVTFPCSYHAGFNHGFNIAEATNFATPSWFPIGSSSKRCLCQPYSVMVDVLLLETMYYRDIFVNKNYRYCDTSDESEIETPLRCTCSWNKDGKPIKMPAESDLFMCMFCHARCHNKCMSHKDMCDICHALQESSLDVEEKDKITMESLKEKFEEINDWFIRPGDVAFLNNNGNIEEIGAITSIEETHARIHAQGTRKDKDIWVDLTSSDYFFLRPKGARASKALAMTTTQNMLSKESTVHSRSGKKTTKSKLNSPNKSRKLSESQKPSEGYQDDIPINHVLFSMPMISPNDASEQDSI